MALHLGVHSVGDGRGGLLGGLRYRGLARVVGREPMLGTELLVAILKRQG